MNGCEICQEIKDKSKRVFSISGTNFSIMPTIGQITEGHLLIISNSHLCASLELPANEIVDLKQIMDNLRDFNKKAYNRDTLFFEHGCNPEKEIYGAASITHMHIHSLPMTKEQSQKVLEIVKDDTNNELIPINELKDLVQWFNTNHKGYIFISDTDNNLFIISSKEKPMSQYMRKVSGLVLDNHNYDWRKFPAEDIIDVVCEKIKKHYQAF